MDITFKHNEGKLELKAPFKSVFVPPTIEQLNITANGTYEAPEGVDGYSPITVDIIPEGVPTDEELTISGDCSYWDYNGKWDNLIETYAGRWSTSDITKTMDMFYYTKLKNIPFTINLKGTVNLNEMFSYSSLESLPTINSNEGIACSNLGDIFSGCTKLKNIPDDYFNFIKTMNNSSNMTGMFERCQKLRNIPSSLNNLISSNSTAYYYSFYSFAFSECHVLDEVVGLGINTASTYTNNIFMSTFNGLNRLKTLTFEAGKIVNWKNQKIGLDRAVGYTPVSADITNNGIGTDKQVIDATTYEALKNDSDWWTTDIAYSRYNHDSAVATINSLPDTSAYLATAGGTNIIEFKGTSGSATDGGAINTLTEEEIAVATAKGWTVALI